MKKDCQGYLIDLDGTIYLGKEPIPAGKRLAEQLQGKGLPSLLVTNNIIKSPETVAQRLANKFNIHVPASPVCTAALATVDYMEGVNRGKEVSVVDKTGLIDLALEADSEWDETNSDYTVVGLDTELSYEKVVLTALTIREGALFAGANPDENIPTERSLLPDAGSVVTSVETATQTKPAYIGKPKVIIVGRTVACLGAEKEQVIMVGDSYEADIQSGTQNGVNSLLVASGLTPKPAVPTLPMPPAYVVDSLDEQTF